MAENQYLQPFFDSLSQGVQVAQSLRQAAQQHAEFEQQQQLAQSQQALRESESLSSLLQSGAGELVPSDGMRPSSSNAGPIQATTTPAAPSTDASTPSTPAPASSSGGTNWTNPSPFTYDAGQVPNSPALPGAPSAGIGTPPDLPNAAPQGGLLTQLNATLPAAPKTPYDPQRIVTIGGKQVYIKTPEEMNAMNLAAEKAKNQIGKIQVTPEMSKAVGGTIPVGSYIDPNHPAYARMVDAITKRGDGNDGKVIQHTQIVKDDNGRQTIITQYTDGSVDEKPLTSRGTSDKFDPANAAARATNSQTKALTETARQAAMDKTLKEYTDATKEEGELNAWRLSAGVAMKTGQHTLDKSGNLKRFSNDASDEEKQAANEGLKAEFDAKTQRLQQVIAQKNDAMQRYAQLSGNPNANPTVGTAQAQANLTGRGGQPQPAAAATPQAKPPAAATASAPKTPTAQKYKVGDVVTSKGKKYKVLGYNQDGSIQAQAL